MYFATLDESDQAVQRYGINVTMALYGLPIRVTPYDEYGQEWSEHYDDYGRPCPSNWPHGRHWQWAPRNMATTYSIPLSKRQTYRIRQLIAHDEWDDQSENRMIVEIIDHRTDITYVLLVGDAVFSPSHPDMRDLQHNNHPFADRSPVIHTTLARPGYSWPPWPCVRNDRNFAELFISFPTYIQEPHDILLNPPPPPCFKHYNPLLHDYTSMRTMQRMILTYTMMHSTTPLASLHGPRIVRIVR